MTNYEVLLAASWEWDRESGNCPGLCHNIGANSPYEAVRIAFERVYYRSGLPECHAVYVWREGRVPIMIDQGKPIITLLFERNNQFLRQLRDDYRKRFTNKNQAFG